MMNKLTRTALFALMFAVSACQPGSSGEEAAPPLAGASLGGPFVLTGETAQKVDSKTFEGQYRLVYFGYTFCPDVCPIDVQKLMAGLSALEKSDAGKAAQIQPLFITADPERDTPEVLTQFTDAFHPRLLGLTGTRAELEPVWKAYGVYAQAGEKRPDGGYLVDHTRNAILFGPKGEPIAIITHDGAPEAIAAELSRWVR